MRRHSPGISAALITALLALTAGAVQGQDVSPPSRAQQQKTIASLKAHPDRVNKYDAEGFTPLMHAAADGAPLVVRYLLQHGARVNLRDQRGYGDPEQFTALGMAIKGENYSIAEELLRRGAKIDGDLDGLSMTSDMTDPVPLLSWAAYYDNLKVIHFMGQHGANMNIVDGHGRVPLSYANNEGVAKALISYGARVNIRTKIAGSLLDFSLLSWHWITDSGPKFWVPGDVVDVLLDAGANDPEAMVIAVSLNSLEPLEKMLQLGWSPDRRGAAGMTPLMVAASEWRPDVVRLLLAHKAQVDLRSPQDQTALMIARTGTGHREYHDFVFDESHQPPLANEASRQEVIRLLVAAGAKQ